MKILVTNDDGVDSPGLEALAGGLAALGTVYVVAPDRERTAAGHALTLHKPLRITRLRPRVYSVSGTPTDCVNLALKKIIQGKVGLVVSGINKGVNLGDDVTYSGTVSAALEGTIMGVPSIAVSQEGKHHFHFKVGATYARRVARLVIEQGLPEETLLNVNVPDRPSRKIQGVRLTTLGRRRFDNPIVEKVDPSGRKYYWIAGTRMSWNRQANSDHSMVRKGFVSVTPIHLDVTHYEALEYLKGWDSLIERRGLHQRPKTKTSRPIR